jgi:tRNA pseudouridine55 synthase
LAFDLGEKLGTGALLDGLVRTRVGGFTVEDAITLNGLEEAFAQGTWQESLKSPESILAGWAIYTLDEKAERAILQGKAIVIVGVDGENERMAAVRGQDGGLLAVVEWNSAVKMWQPRKVFGV